MTSQNGSRTHLHDTPEIDAASILPPPRTAKREQMRANIVTHAAAIEFVPSAEYSTHVTAQSASSIQQMAVRVMFVSMCESARACLREFACVFACGLSRRSLECMLALRHLCEPTHAHMHRFRLSVLCGCEHVCILCECVRA